MIAAATLFVTGLLREAAAQGPAAIPGQSSEVAEVQITDPNGNPLPPEVQAEIRKALASQPTASRSNNDHGKAGNGEIIVSGIRQRGAVSGNIPPERVFDAADVKALGASDVEGIIKGLAPRLPAQIGSNPVALLINGKRTASYADISTYPAEAIERIEVLPEAAATAYGFPTGQKLINIITFERFRQIGSNSTGEFPFRGGGTSLQQKLQLFQISGERRGNLYAKIERQDALLYKSVGISDLPGRSLLPELTSILIRPSVNTSIGRASLGAQLKYGRDISKTLLGPTSDRPSVFRFDDRDIAAGINAGARLDRFSISLISQFATKREKTSFSGRLPDFAPESTSYDERSASAEAVLSGPLFALPAGAAFLSTKVLLNSEHASRFAGSTVAISDVGRSKGEASFTLNAPLLGQQGGCAGALGCLIGSVGAQQVVSARLHRTSYNVGLIWTPSSKLNVNYNWGRQVSLPPLRLLAQPLTVVPDIPVRDALTNRVELVDISSGGNPDLRASVIRRSEARIDYKPLSGQDLIITGSVLDQRTSSPILNILAASELLQSAFPARFERDSSGKLVKIDTTPINAAFSATTELRVGFAFNTTLGRSSAGEGSTITRSVPAGGITNGLPPGSVVIMADEGSALDQLIADRDSRVFLSMNYLHRTRYKIRFGNGVGLDVLKSGPTDEYFGIPRSEIEAQAGFSKNGLGAKLSAHYEGVRLAGFGPLDASSRSETKVSPSAVVDLSAFVEFQKVTANPLLSRARLTLSINNAFNAVRQLKLDQNQKTPEVLPFFLAPKGRTIALTFRETW